MLGRVYNPPLLRLRSTGYLMMNASSRTCAVYHEASEVTTQLIAIATIHDISNATPSPRVLCDESQPRCPLDQLPQLRILALHRHQPLRQSHLPLRRLHC